MSETILRLAARGDGVTESGRFFAGTAPGDVIGDDNAVSPGPYRQVPPCRHFGRCGGCQLQHIDDEAYAGFVTDRIVSALAAQGLPIPEMRQPHLSPPRSRRRVSLKARRRGKSLEIGYLEAASHRLIDIAECPIMAPPLFNLLRHLRQLLPPLLRDKRQAEIRMTLADQGVDLSISGIEVEGLAATEALTDFAQRHALARLSIDEGYGTQVRYEPEPIMITLGGVAVSLPENAFLQATADGEAALVSSVCEAVGDATTAVDLFAGLGTFSFALPGKVHAVEGARDAILALQSAANLARRLVSSEHRDLFRRPLTAAELTRFEAVVLDPPRAGAKEQVAEIAISAAPRLAYVSCNPATFARDAKMLFDGGYSLDWVRPVGQFRWSTHVELAAAFSR